MSLSLLVGTTVDKLVIDRSTGGLKQCQILEVIYEGLDGHGSFLNVN